MDAFIVEFNDGTPERRYVAKLAAGGWLQALYRLEADGSLTKVPAATPGLDMRYVAAQLEQQAGAKFARLLPTSKTDLASLLLTARLEAAT